MTTGTTVFWERDRSGEPTRGSHHKAAYDWTLVYDPLPHQMGGIEDGAAFSATDIEYTLKAGNFLPGTRFELDGQTFTVEYNRDDGQALLIGNYGTIYSVDQREQRPRLRLVEAQA